MRLRSKDPREDTRQLSKNLQSAFGDLFAVNVEDYFVREKGYYGTIYAKPARAVRNALNVDREMLILISTFQAQQPRTIKTALDIISDAGGRLEASAFIVVHRDKKGNSKLKTWGREQGLAVLPIYVGDDEIPVGDEFLRYISYEMYSHDPFDITGPVADDVNFYGRREEAIDLAKKLQGSQIRSCFGIRKIGKTSIIHRIILETRKSYDTKIVFIDASRDAIFGLSAANLLNSISRSVDFLNNNVDDYIDIEPSISDIDVSTAAERLRQSVMTSKKTLILFFDEVDYITPGSPTNGVWRQDFNPFWRNIRAIYQSSKLNNYNLSLFISGVSSKWFSVESIDGIENAALAFVPEEYLTPLPKGAAVAMIRRLGKQAGIAFNDDAASAIAETCAMMPFWIRKACSYIHSKIEIGLRPFQPQQKLIEDFLRDFAQSDGSAMSQVALSHLFRVYPELRESVFSCARGSGSAVPAKTLRALEKYGVIKSARTPTISGELMTRGIELAAADDLEADAHDKVSEMKNSGHIDLGDWADELAILARRRNLIERKMRDIVINFMRYAALDSPNAQPAKDRILRSLDTKRRESLTKMQTDDIMSRLYWLELISIIKKDWILFDKLFSDKLKFEEMARIVNERPDAHAKIIDLADLALHRRALTWLEEKLQRI